MNHLEFPGNEFRPRGLVRRVDRTDDQERARRETGGELGQVVPRQRGRHRMRALEQLMAAIDAALTMFTCLGNGCPGVLPRHDNIVQRALDLHRHLWLCFIADGVHIVFPALRNHLDLVLHDGRCIVTTDAAYQHAPRQGLGL